MHKSQLKRPETQYPYYNFNIYCLIPESVFNELVGKIAIKFPGADLHVYKIENHCDTVAFVEAKYDFEALKQTRQIIANDIYAMIDKAIYQKKFEEKAKQTI